MFGLQKGQLHVFWLQDATLVCVFGFQEGGLSCFNQSKVQIAVVSELGEQLRVCFFASERALW